MSRKRREERERVQRSHRRRTIRFIALAALVCVIVVAFKLPELWRSAPAPKPPVQVQHWSTYLARELPRDDEQARKLIRAEYFNFDGFQIVRRESDIPIEHLLVPDHDFSEAELKIIVTVISIVGMVNGEDDRVFVALKEWAERKENRIIREILPLDRKYAIRGDNYQFAFDAFWSPEMGSIYMGRHQMPYFMLFLSTLYQEAFHAVQLHGRKISLEENAQIEHEAHQAQLEFNRRLRKFIESMPENERRFRLELDVIDENLKDSLEAYQRNLIERTGVLLPK